MTNEHSSDLLERFNLLNDENSNLKFELNTLKAKVNSLIIENQMLRRNIVSLQARAEQEEEFISNTLIKQIYALKKEKETLALNYEQEEEFITNELSRKLLHLQQEKLALEKTLEKEQEAQVTKLNERIQKLESDVRSKQESLEMIKREKIQLENTLEQEQEALVNKLWKKIERLEEEKKFLKGRFESISPSKMDGGESFVTPDNLALNDELSSSVFRSRNSSLSKPRIATSRPSSSEIDPRHQLTLEEVSTSAVSLHEEVKRLRSLLFQQQKEYPQKIRAVREEEMAILEENRRLRCHLQREVERRKEMSRNFSESESSLEMDEERLFNDRIRRESANQSTRSLHASLGAAGQKSACNPGSGEGGAGSTSTRFPAQSTRPSDYSSDCEAMSTHSNEGMSGNK